MPQCCRAGAAPGHLYSDLCSVSRCFRKPNRGIIVASAPPLAQRVLHYSYLAYQQDVRVSTGGFIERVLTQGADVVDASVAYKR